MTRDQRIDLRVTEEEKAAIVEAAKARGVTVSAYIMERVMAKPTLQAKRCG